MLRYANEQGDTYFECDLCKVRFENPTRIGPHHTPIRDLIGAQPEWLLYALTLYVGSNPHTLDSRNQSCFHVCPACADTPFSEIIRRLPYLERPHAS